VNGGTEAKEEAEAFYVRLSEVVKEELEYEMKPEVLNRIDEIVVFAPLSQSDLSMIADLILQQTVNRAQNEREMTLSVSPKLTQKVMQEGSSSAAQFGARPMRRAAQRFFEDAISDAIVRGFLKVGDSATVDLAESEDHRHYSVEVKRSSDGKVLLVPVERVSGGIGSSPSTKATTTTWKVDNEASTETALDTETVTETALDTETVN
jgi:ATP-dependent Clp protease ATP-binding subunit ClpC